MLLNVVLYILGVASVGFASALKPSDIMIVMTAQESKVSRAGADSFVADLRQQFPEDPPQIELTHLYEEKIPRLGSWTIYPAVAYAAERSVSASWYVFLRERTELNLPLLIENLKDLDPAVHHFLGKDASDDHAWRKRRNHNAYHYLIPENDLKFPEIHAGVVLSQALVRDTTKKVVKDNMNFSIWPGLEFAWYIKERHDLFMTHAPFLCSGREQDKEKCATTHPTEIRTCGEPASYDDVLFAVKSTKKYHKMRLTGLYETWIKPPANVVVFSDAPDTELPEVVDLGIANQPKGHCAKMMKIIQSVQQEPYKKYKWVMVVDDDTLVYTERVLQLVSCYSHEDELFLGEIYGMTFLNGGGWPYNFMTGGAGTLFSRGALDKYDHSECRCGSPSAPDDMAIGSCLRFQKFPPVDPINVDEFHQDHPHVYPKAMLQATTPITLHHIYYEYVSPEDNHSYWYPIKEMYDVCLAKGDQPTSLTTCHWNQKQDGCPPPEELKAELKHRKEKLLGGEEALLAYEASDEL